MGSVLAAAEAGGVLIGGASLRAADDKVFASGQVIRQADRWGVAA